MVIVTLHLDGRLCQKLNLEHSYHDGLFYLPGRTVWRKIKLEQDIGFQAEPSTDFTLPLSGFYNEIRDAAFPRQLALCRGYRH